MWYGGLVLDKPAGKLKLRVYGLLGVWHDGVVLGELAGEFMLTYAFGDERTCGRMNVRDGGLGGENLTGEFVLGVWVAGGRGGVEWG